MKTVTVKIHPVVEVSEFSFINPAGGTGMSNWKFNASLEGPVKVTIVEGWFDYEAGHRFIGTSCDDRLTAYLEAVSNSSDRRVFFSQYQIVGQPNDLVAKSLMRQANPASGDRPSHFEGSR